MRTLECRMSMSMQLLFTTWILETDRESYNKEEWLEEFLDSKDIFYNGNASDNDDESYNENNEQ